MITCQFCGADTSKVERPKEVKAQTGYIASPSIQKAYTAVSIYWAASGLLQAVLGVSNGSFFNIIVGVFHLVVGIGMVARLNVFRGIAHFLCWVRLVIGLCFVVGGLLGTNFFGPISFITVGIGIQDAVVAALMIYLIAETNTHFRM